MTSLRIPWYLLAAFVFGPAMTFSVPGRAEPVTFSNDVAPIFYRHCVACHRPNHIAPMSLLTHKEARPWAASIAREVQLRNMPPFSGESDRYTWRNDISLSDAQIETIVKWVEEGARAGDPADLPNPPVFPESWTLGEPDYVVTLDEVAIAAQSEDLFPQQWATIDIDTPQWIRAIEFLPGDRRALHHVQTTYNSPADNGAQLGSSAAARVGILAIWTAGMPPYVFPEGMGRVVNPGTRILVDSHYHPFGEATVDRTRIGLYFGEGPLKKEVATLTAANTGLRIPPGAANHAEKAFHLFDRDMQILAFSPHLHVRGKAMRYDLVYPDGRVETLLDVPKYNYNWQWLYYPTEPIDVPAGSRVDVTAVWDNSPDNPDNPDPTQEIIYRGNTFNEMFVGFLEVAPKDGVYHEQPVPGELLRKILRKHPAEDCYVVQGFFPFGVYAPRSGEGWLYLLNGLLMFTISLDEISWNGNSLEITAQLPTPEASATESRIVAERSDDGKLKGRLFYGVDGDNPMTLPFVGLPAAAGDSQTD